MADSLLRTENIWMNGKELPFDMYQSSAVLHQLMYSHSGATPVEKQKNQICLHYTAGNNAAQGTINYWSQHAPVPFAWVCPRYFRNAPNNHNWGTQHQWMCSRAGCSWTGSNGKCPTHHVRKKNECPQHGPVEKGRLRASAQYIVEPSQERLNGNAHDYSDVVEVINSEYVAYHAGVINENSVGIEIANCGWNFQALRHDAVNGAGSARRPTDGNRWLSLPAAVLTALQNASNHETNLSHRDFQAYQEEQYRALIFLLRFLCIKHSIPRVFFGDSTHEKLKRWWHNVGNSSAQAEKRSRVMRFRGILSHMNVHGEKECGGPALHRNRLYRGITDEWWMPLQLDGRHRTYYTGPFDIRNNIPGFVRFHNGHPHAVLFRDADVDALQETRSYFDMDLCDWYYANTETAQPGDRHGIGSGTFPIGRNKIWHGGVHLFPPGADKNVYAAASGTIVAARIAGNNEVASDLNYGSQCFILIRHVVYHQTTTDPDGGQSIDYTVAPSYFFSLYMHIAPVLEPDNPNNINNPPWYNKYRRNHAAPSPLQTVFCPDIEVMVGDWIGVCGPYRGRDLIHFEIMSRTELSVAPWDGQPARDTNTDMIADSAVIDSIVTDTAGDGIDMTDILRSADRLRRVKSYYRSEWALSNQDHLAPVVPRIRRRSIWQNLQHFMWVEQAISACPDIGTQLCDRTGFFWHYHPVTFMKFVNSLIMEQNRETDENMYASTNVEIERGFLTRFLWRPRRRCPQNNAAHQWFADSGQCPTHHAQQANTSFVTQQADATRIRPYDISSNQADYTLTRVQIACSANGAHTHGATPPTSTHLSLTLVDIVESVRQRFGAAISVGRSYLCPAHASHTAANRQHCILGTDAGITAHGNGLAIDIGPGGNSAADARRFWTIVDEVIDEYNASIEDFGGEASRANLTDGIREATYTPSAPAAAPYRLHIELIEAHPVTQWECWIKKPSTAESARVADHTIIGVYTTRDAARRETIASVTETSDHTHWENVVRRNSTAIRAKVYAGGIIGVFGTQEEAEREKCQDFSWPKLVR